MKCAWQAYMNLIPRSMRWEVEKFGRYDLQEFRMRTGIAPEMILRNGTHIISGQVKKEDIAFVINSASEYSPWVTESIANGYITAPGGHRIGICGPATVRDKKMQGISMATSLCIRVARDFEGIASKASKIQESILIIGPPGSGKTTLLRDFIREKSNSGQGSVSVVDEREEIFPFCRGQACFSTGCHTDVLSGCGKAEGIDAVLRSMNPEWIAVDEITSKEDSLALLQAGWCGVQLVATAHAGSIKDYLTRPIYRPLVENNLFTTAIVLQRDKSWRFERITV